MDRVRCATLSAKALMFAGIDAVAGLVVYRAEQGRLVAVVERVGARVTLNREGEPVRVSAHGVPLGTEQTAAIARWKTLNSLAWTGGHIPPEALGDLVALPNLRYLDLSFSDSRAESLRMIARCRSLHEVLLRRSPWVDDEGLESLCELPELTALDVSETPITDAGLAKLAACRDLQDLTIDRCTSLTAAGIRQLVDYPSLQWVRARDLPIDPSTQAALRARRPQMTWWLNPGAQRVAAQSEPASETAAQRPDAVER